MRLVDGEPQPAQWHSVSIAEFAQRLVETAQQSSTRLRGGGGPLLLAVNGRSASGKTTLAGGLAAELPGSVLVHTDDLCWHEPMFAWAHVQRELISQIQQGGQVSFRPPQWELRKRAGEISIPADTEVVIFEGVGSSQSEVADLLHASAWVQADFDVAEQRGIARDLLSGENGNEEQTIAFWHAWIADERAHLRSDQPWGRADLLVTAPPSPGSPDLNAVLWGQI